MAKKQMLSLSEEDYNNLREKVFKMKSEGKNISLSSFIAMAIKKELSV